MHILHTHTHTHSVPRTEVKEASHSLSGARSPEPGARARVDMQLLHRRGTAPKPRNAQCACARPTHSCVHKGDPGALPDSDVFISQIKALVEPVERTRSLNSGFLVKAALHPTLQYRGGKDILPGCCRERIKGWRNLLFGAYECLFLLRRIFQFGHRT